MDDLIREVQAGRRRVNAKRAYDVLDLALRRQIFAEAAEVLYDRAGGDLVASLALAHEEGLRSGSSAPPPISAVGRRR